MRHQQEEFMATAQQYHAVVRQNMVIAVTRNNEARSYIVQMRVQQLEQEANAQITQHQDEWNYDLDFLKRRIKLSKISSTFDDRGSTESIQTR